MGDFENIISEIEILYAECEQLKEMEIFFREFPDKERGIGYKFLKDYLCFIKIYLKALESQNEELTILNSRELLFQWKKTLPSQITFYELLLVKLNEHLSEIQIMNQDEWDKMGIGNKIGEETKNINLGIESLSIDTQELKKIEIEVSEMCSTWKDFEQASQNEIEGSKERLKHIFSKYQTAIPNDFKKVLTWYLSTERFGELSFKNIPKKLKNLRIEDKDVVNWSREYSKQFNKLFESPLKPKRSPKESLSLKEHFIKKDGKQVGTTKLDDLKNHLYRKGLLSEDKTTWVGIGMNGKIQLASLIKFVGLRFFQTPFSEKQVKLISEKDFNIPLSEGSIKKGKAEFGETYLDKFL